MTRVTIYYIYAAGQADGPDAAATERREDSVVGATPLPPVPPRPPARPCSGVRARCTFRVRLETWATFSGSLPGKIQYSRQNIRRTRQAQRRCRGRRQELAGLLAAVGGDPPRQATAVVAIEEQLAAAERAGRVRRLDTNIY